MTTTTNTCLPCTIPEFDRNLYYTGKLLTARDLSDEQRYFRDKQRLHYLALHGWGVVCGLRVKPHPYCPALKIVIEEGFAVDDCGREIRILQPAELDVPQPTPKPTIPPRAPQAYDQAAEPPPEELGKKLYICLSYQECETEQMPAPFDDCGCNSNGQRAGRALESYRLQITETEPACLKHHKEEHDCGEMYWGRHHHCPQPGQNCCLLLAVIHRFVAGLPVTEEMIDMRSRRVLRATQELDHLLRCLIEKLPTRKLTHIRNFNWIHGNEMHYHDFLRQYVGEGKPGFEIEFNAPVHQEGINPRTFQATIVHTRPGPGRHVELAPARVDLEPARCSLKIEHEYAQQLREKDFDLFLTLKCDKVLDESGLAVDGNLLARLVEDDEGRKRYSVTTPTGDGIPGGLFESWIRVRTNVPVS